MNWTRMQILKCCSTSINHKTIMLQKLTVIRYLPFQNVWRTIFCQRILENYKTYAFKWLRIQWKLRTHLWRIYIQGPWLATTPAEKPTTLNYNNMIYYLSSLRKGKIKRNQIINPRVVIVFIKLFKFQKHRRESILNFSKIRSNKRWNRHLEMIKVRMISKRVWFKTKLKENTNRKLR